jgi:hypothetical protein
MLRHEEIDWTSTPWETDIFDDVKDMKSVRRAILTLNQALTVSTSLS